MSPLTREATAARRPHSAPVGTYRSTARVSAPEHAGPRGRFRVIVRRPLPPPYRLRRAAPRNPLRRALSIAGLPALILTVYVALWTAAMDGGYYKQSISNQIQALQIENDTLQASLRGLQSPRRILARARGMGMRPADAVQFVEVRPTRRVAQAPSLAPPPALGTVLPTAAPAPR